MKEGFITVAVNGAPKWSVFITTSLNVLVMMWLLADMTLTISKLSAQGWAWNSMMYTPYITLVGLTVVFIYVLAQTFAQMYSFSQANLFTVILATISMPAIITALWFADKLMTK